MRREPFFVYLFVEEYIFKKLQQISEAKKSWLWDVGATWMTAHELTHITVGRFTTAVHMSNYVFFVVRPCESYTWRGRTSYPGPSCLEIVVCTLTRWDNKKSHLGP